MRNILLAALMMTTTVSAGAVPSVQDSWFRVLPGKLPAAGYFVLKNNGPATALTGASSPVCGSLLLHMTHQMNGMMHMMEVASVAVPAGASVTFATGGYHLMCVDPKPALKPGATAAVTLTFEGGATTTANFAVKAAGKD
jgi:Uncharacterized protein conserved in bacteria